MASKEEFLNHQLWEICASALKALNELKAIVENDEKEFLNRSIGIVERIKSSKRRSAQSELFTISTLNSVASNIGQVEQFAHSRRGGKSNQLANAIAHAESALGHTATWPESWWPKGVGIAAIEEELGNIRTTRDEQIDAFAQEIESLRDKLSATHDEHLDAADKVRQEIAGLRSVAEKLATDAEDAAASIDDEKSRIDDVIDKGLTKTSEFIDASNTKMSQFLSAQNEIFENNQKDMRERLDAKLSAADDLLKKMQERTKELDKLTAVNAADIFAGSYEDQSSSAKKAGLIFIAGGLFSVILAAVLVFLSMSGFIPAEDGTDEWVSFASRLTVTGLLVGVSTVLIRFGSQNLAEATRTKKLELELRTIGPFLANIGDPSAADQARLDLVDRAFGANAHESAGSKPGEETLSVSGISQLLQAVAKILGK